MANRTETTCVSISKELMPKAKKRAAATERGNFSAYVERLIQADVSKADRASLRQERDLVAA